MIIASTICLSRFHTEKKIRFGVVKTSQIIRNRMPFRSWFLVLIPVSSHLGILQFGQLHEPPDLKRIVPWHDRNHIFSPESKGSERSDRLIIFPGDSSLSIALPYHEHHPKTTCMTETVRADLKRTATLRRHPFKVDSPSPI